ncbi:MAG: hypothetical protein JKY86_15490 [Gammaproteobacteria bacterium]|nr:hypothetical protein [Gammaproteobacteria bacterium]
MSDLNMLGFILIIMLGINTYIIIDESNKNAAEIITACEIRGNSDD